MITTSKPYFRAKDVGAIAGGSNEAENKEGKRQKNDKISRMH